VPHLIVELSADSKLELGILISHLQELPGKRINRSNFSPALDHACNQLVIQGIPDGLDVSPCPLHDELIQPFVHFLDELLWVNPDGDIPKKAFFQHLQIE
jgi:hypothetical protein